MSVWRIGSNYGEKGSIVEIFRQYNIAFAGDEKPQDKILTDVGVTDIVAITSGQQIIAVGRVRKKTKLSETGTDLSKRFGDINALILEPLFWRNKNEEWLLYEGQGTQFNKAHGKYEREIMNIFNDRNRHYQEDKMKDEILALLEAHHQIILTGAPGTGKTHLAREVAAKMIGLEKVDDLEDYNDRFKFVQFHPAYDYTDFVEGLKPVNDGEVENGQIAFKVQPGHFMKFCTKAAEICSDAEKKKIEPPKCVFVIDEINRADLSRVFGELFYALEPSYRGKTGAVSTQYVLGRTESDRKDFYVPENVFIIGTMNDVDRSVESIDFALRRRFAWYEIKANADRFEAVIQQNLDEKIKNEAKNRYIRLNSQIEQTEGLSCSYHIGPAYFRKLEEYIKKYPNEKEMWEVFWDRHLELLVREYLRGQSDEKEKHKKIHEAYDNPKSEPPNQS